MISFVALFTGCSEQNNAGKEIIKINTQWLDSIKHKSDSSWVKSYRSKEFVSAEYYVDKKDSIVTQLMKDSAGAIRQINIAKYNRVRLFFAEYYANGQLVAKLPVNEKGQYEGPSKSYYEDGSIRSSGLYRNGFYYGEWKNFDSKGRLVSADVYDQNGQLEKNIPAH